MISIPKGKDDIYYAYKEKSGKLYFHEPIKNITSWEVPPNSVIYDGEKLLLLKYVDGNNIDPREKRHTKSPFKHFSSCLPKDNIILEFSRKKFIQKRLSVSYICNANSNFVQENLKYLPFSIEADRKLTAFQGFIDKHFALNTKKKNSRKLLILKEVPEFATAFTQDESKIINCIKNSEKLISRYIKKQKAIKIYKLVHIVSSSVFVVDEIYLQLLYWLKITKTVDSRYRCWELLLVMATLLLPDEQIRPIIRNFLAISSFSIHKTISRIAQLSYIRFTSMCKTNCNFRDLSDKAIAQIPYHLINCPFLIGASLHELSFLQNTTSNFLMPVPIFVHKICEIIIEKGSSSQNEIFQVSSSKQKMDEIINEIDIGIIDLSKIDVKVLGSLLKKWICSLPEPLVPSSLLSKYPIDNYLEIISKINELNKNVLGYLVGFLTRFYGKSNQNIDTISFIFGYDIMKLSTINPSEIKKYTAIAKSFFRKLIEEWDVSFIYPLKQ